MLPLALLLGACSPTRRVPPGEHLLKRNAVVLTDRAVPVTELESIIKQKPNKKVLGLRFYLSMYNVPDPARIERHKLRRTERIDAINERRAERGKAPKPYGRTTGEWLRDVVGEPPVLLDSALTERSTDQMELYLHKEGWFNGRVLLGLVFFALLTPIALLRRLGRADGLALRKPKGSLWTVRDLSLIHI